MLLGSYLSVELDGLNEITQQVMSVPEVTEGSSLRCSVSQLLYQREIHPETDKHSFAIHFIQVKNTFKYMTLLKYTVGSFNRNYTKVRPY